MVVLVLGRSQLQRLLATSFIALFLIAPGAGAMPARIEPIIRLTFDEVSNDAEANSGRFRNYALANNSYLQAFNGAFVSLSAPFSERGRYLQQPLNNSGLSFPDVQALNTISNGFTLSAYIYPKSTSSGRQRIISRWFFENSNRSFSLYLQNGKVVLSLSSTGDDLYFVESPSSVGLNTWTFVGASFDGMSAKLYVGDKVTPVVTSTFVPRTIRASVYPLYIGARDSSGFESFNGNLDEIFVYNHPRTRFGRQYNITAPTVVRLGEYIPVHVSVLTEQGDVYAPTEKLSFAAVTGLAGIPSSLTVSGGVGSFSSVTCTKEGIFRLIASVNGGGFQVESNPIVCKKTIDARVFWGDMHWHSNLALNFTPAGQAGGHAEQSPDFGYSYARDVASLDFTAMNEHDFRLLTPEADWQKQIDLANRYHRPGRFVTLLGWEWGGRATASLQDPVNSDGHHNVLFPGKGDDAYRLGINVPKRIFLGSPNPFLERVFDAKNRLYQPSYWDGDGIISDWEKSDAFHELRALLSPYGATITPHHLGYSKHLQGVPTTYHRVSMPYIEIYSKWGASEYKNNPRTGESQRAALREGRQIQLAQDLLQKGYRIGFVGGSDGHRTRPGTVGREYSTNLAYKQPGLTAVMSSEKKRGSLWSALVGRRTYATSASRIYVEFNVNGVGMGQETLRSSSGTASYSLKVAGTNDFQVEVVRDGVTIKRLTKANYTGDRILQYSATESLSSGVHWYYLRVIQVDGERAWSSPIWVK